MTEPLLQDYVTHAAERRGDAVAVEMGERHLTYGALEAASNRIARLLRDAGCGRGDRVCLFTPKSLDAIVGMIGVLKTGAMYVPIDVASPLPRLERIVRSADPRAVLVAAPAAALVDALVAAGAIGADVAIGSFESRADAGDHLACRFTRDDVDAADAAPLPRTSCGDDGAHLLFTSGSTGAPKGVVVTHASVVHFVEWAREYFGIDASDRNSGHPPLYFDLSTFDVHGTFAAGARLHLVPAELNLLPHLLATFVRTTELTQWFSVPSVLSYMAKHDVVRPGDFPTLRRLLWCGEAIPVPTLRYWMARVPHATFTNLYGPTEATIASSHYTVPDCPADDRTPVPIGWALPGEELLVLDEAMREVPDGEVGDLYIGGAGLSPGYWRDPEKTRAAFLHDDRDPTGARRLYRTGDLARRGADGAFHFVGRADSQIKSRGYRIELGEIEVALGTVHGVGECAVVGVQSDGFEGTAICCAYVPRADCPIEASTVRQEIARTLPSYMLPSRWMLLDSLPKNANGKIDRPHLRQLFAGGRDTG